MDKVLGYDIAQWGLFFRLGNVSKYVMQVAKETGLETFIHPLAVEIDKVITEILHGTVKIPGVDLSYGNRNKIVEYIGTHIEPVTNTRTINPPMLLLVMIERLYDVNFKPMEEVLGVATVKEFIKDFANRALDSDELGKVYGRCSTLVYNILDPEREYFADKTMMTKYKKEFKVILDSSYTTISHGIDHIDTVYKKATHLKVKYNLDVNRDELVVATLFHDMFSHMDRANHHTLGHDWIMHSIHPMINFSNKEKQERVALAIAEHRASYGGMYSSVLSELLATADREPPNIESIIKRSYYYAVERNPSKSHSEIISNIVNHLKEKFSRNGYSKYTNMYVLEYGRELAIMYDIIDKIVDSKIKINIAKQKDKLKVTLKRKGA